MAGFPVSFKHHAARGGKEEQPQTSTYLRSCIHIKSCFCLFEWLQTGRGTTKYKQRVEYQDYPLPQDQRQLPYDRNRQICRVPCIVQSPRLILQIIRIYHQLPWRGVKNNVVFLYFLTNWTKEWVFYIRSFTYKVSTMRKTF